MDEDEFIQLLDQADRDLDAFPFWSSFKRACAAHPIKGIDKLTPGRQAVLILWEANTQTRDENGKILTLPLDGELMPEKLDKLKEDLIGHVMNEDIDELALRRFFKSIAMRIRA